MPAGQEYSLDRLAGARRYNAWLYERAEPFLGARVLEVGAGLGTFTELLAAAGREVVAVEPSPPLASFLRERFQGYPCVTVVETDALGTPRDGFDSVLCLNVLEHIADDAAALRGLRERLRPGGHLLLLVPAHPFLFCSLDRAFRHERRYAKRQLVALIEQAGLRVVRVRLVNPLGAAGWLLFGRLLGSRELPGQPLRAYDRLVPLLRVLDRVELPLGLSLWAVARRSERLADASGEGYG